MFKQGNSSNRQKMNGPFIASSKDFAADCELTQISLIRGGFMLKSTERT